MSLFAKGQIKSQFNVSGIIKPSALVKLSKYRVPPTLCGNV